MSQDTRISELPQAAALAGDETLPLVQSGQTRRATVAALRSGLAAGTHTHPAVALSDATVAGRTLLTATDATAQRTALALGSLATQAASAVAITGGGINGTDIGATTPGAGTFTALSATGVSWLQEVRAQNALISIANGGAYGVYVRNRPAPNDDFGIIGFFNNAGTVLQAEIASTPANDLRFRTSGQIERARITSTQMQCAVPVVPMSDGAYSLGSANMRWNDIYATNTAIQTSDARAKTDVVDCPLGLDFILALRPARYRFTDIDQPAETACRSVERMVTAPVTREREEVRRVDGQYRLETVTETVEEPVLRLEPLFDGVGRPLLDSAGNQRLHPVPVTETVEVEEVIRPARIEHHHRPHDGLIAQEVKAVLDRLGLDMAAYIYDRDTDLHGLRYGEFIAPLIRAVQELATRVTLLERTAA